MNDEAIMSVSDTAAPSWRYPILTTKLFVPTVRGGSVSRPRLVHRITEGLASRLTVIAAPPGFGKTTLLVEWLGSPEAESWRTAWLSLDSADSDPARFLS
ncbi:MAG: hypothetical protein ACOC9Y_06900, partial [Chloroflexota bacterium]